MATALIMPTTGNTVTGTATFQLQVGGSDVELTVELADCPEGDHGIHIHEMGDCSNDGAMTGTHWNPTQVDHGDFGATPSHAGDLGNITCASDGVGSLTRASDRWTLGGPPTTNVINRAIILHADPDTFGPPTGQAGTPIACGAID